MAWLKSNNPAPGNKAGGLTTILEKSLGAVSKGGTTNLNEVYLYAEKVVEKGLVYQSQKPVFWSTGAQTALAEAEVEYQERDDTAVYVAFTIVSGSGTVAETVSFPPGTSIAITL